ncbi:80098020-1c09-4886-abde-787280242245 [Sclerotinia trifoliorum]|uniref:80098020-1c09-4886-abde-787280242245 n=1 Tax=Sclerotinia trifoliorum TaxID=28548 RepID=A0A8H2ZLD1_9HELO|nr:80098020-1c09-4886-abde-787280242245 [Sclerotinia trifoliorum]
MHFSTAKALLPLSVLVSYTAAQTTAATTPVAPTGGSSSACLGQNVLDACLSSTTAIAQACQSTDYSCLCTSWNAVLTCYNQCPNDAGYAGALSNKQTYCNNASIYTSTSSLAISKDWPTSATATAAGGSGPTGVGANAGAGATGTTTRASTMNGSGSKTSTASASGAESSDKSSGVGERGISGLVGVLGGVGAVVMGFL